jgi:ribose transport system substrate-binding protein
MKNGLSGFGLKTLGLWSIVASAMLLGQALGAEGPAGITAPVVLAPFNPSAPACGVPTGLNKSLGFAEDNTRAFIAGVGNGLAAAAHDRGLSYEAVSADNDAAKQAEQVEAFRQRGFGGIVVPPVDSVALAPVLQRMIWGGGYVATVVPPPAITILNAPQYLTGKTLADAAAAYIRDHLGGKADVVLLTQDSLQFLAPRFAAMRDTLGNLPGVNIVADISPVPVSAEGGFDTMNLILEAHPNVDVVLGADAVVLGALKALRQAGKARPDQFIGGIDGEPDAIAELQSADSPFKTTVALSSPIFGYALGINAADWLDGKSVPQAMDALPIALSHDTIAGYEADQAHPGAVYADPARRAVYLKAYGNICTDTRDQYLNFPWSSEGY